MSFFKKLKSRLFGSSEDPVSKKEKEITVSREKELQKEIKVEKYVAGLSKTSLSFSEKVRDLRNRHNKIDENYFEELEEALIMSDISYPLVEEILFAIKREVRNENVTDISLINEIIADKLFIAYTTGSVVDTGLNIKKDQKNVVLVVGVNGAGKTTSIAKIANKYINEGFKVLVAAGDTFRAGAVAQLEEWVTRVGASIVKSEREGADPASVVYEAMQKYKNEDFDLLIIDTAGRLQNKVNLMNELKKMNSIVQREIPEAPHESLIVIDATTGQNGVSQAKNFKDVTPLTGIVLTKMDGTSKGGIILTIKEQLGLAVKLIGLGEKLDDLQEFDLDAFIYGMTKELMKEE